MSKTMFEKIWEAHVVRQDAEQPALLYIDLHLVHEVTSPQAFDGLRLNGRKVRRPELTVATMDHNVPTTDRSLPIADEISRRQMDALARNCRDFGITLYDIHDKRQGIVHVIGPELGLTQPGMTIVCGDSHTSTHGAFGALAFGIGTSEVEHVLATQCLPQSRPKTMEIRWTGSWEPASRPKTLFSPSSAKSARTARRATRWNIRARRSAALSMEGRMTVCNMSIEAGARAGMIAPDEKTLEYLKGRPFAPQGADWEAAIAEWRQLPTDAGATFDTTIVLNAGEIAPYVSWGTNPGMALPITEAVPVPDALESESERRSTLRALEYMGLEPGMPLQSLMLDKVFIGSCTNGRIEDLRAAAAIARGHKVNPRVHALVVPGSAQVKRQAEAEGLDKIFQEAGFDWREAGCSMCLGMNPDILQPGQRCASTSNRNFEGRQGKGGRTHLVSPQMAAAAAIAGHLVDIRDWQKK